MFFFFNDTATTEIYTYRHTLSLHDALPISDDRPGWIRQLEWAVVDYSLENLMTFPAVREAVDAGELTLHGAYFGVRSEEHTSELQSLMRISYAVFCLKKKKNKQYQENDNIRI